MICQLIKDKPSVIFKSYHLKTVLLELITASDQEKIENTYFFFAKLLVERLRNTYENAKFPNYFIPSQNLLENENDFTEIIQKLNQITQELMLVAK